MNGAFAATLALAIAANAAVAQAPLLVHAPNLHPAKFSLIVDTLWTVGLDESAGPDSLFGIMAGLLSAPGSHRAVVPEPHASEIRTFDAGTGRFLGRMGRRGGGPGEFRFVFKAAVTDDGTTLGYDVGRGVVVEFDTAFQYQREVRIELPVSPESFLANDELLVISGTLSSEPYSRRAIHVFSREDGRHLRSFGRLPDTQSAVVSEAIGAGLITWARDGNLWHTQRAPYLIQKFTVDGDVLVRLERDNDFLPSAESSYQVSFQGRRVKIEQTPHAVCVAIVELDDGTLLHQVWLTGHRYVLDVFDADLSLRASYEAEMPVLASSLQSGRYLASGKGPDQQFWIGAIRLHLN